MWNYKRFYEEQKFSGTPPPFDKGLRAIIEFLLLPPSFRSMSYKQPEPPRDKYYFEIGGIPMNLVTPFPYKVFCDKLRELKSREFESIVADLLRKLGGDVNHSSKGADGGIDLLWKTHEGEEYIVQCKRWKNKVGEPIVREICWVATKCQAKGVFIVTASEFTDNAIGVTTDSSLRVGFIDGKELFNLMSLQMPTVVEDIREGRWKSHK